MCGGVGVRVSCASKRKHVCLQRRPRVSNMRTFEGTHGSVLNVHTGTFRCTRISQHTRNNTTHFTAHTTTPLFSPPSSTHINTHTHTHQHVLRPTHQHAHRHITTHTHINMHTPTYRHPSTHTHTHTHSTHTHITITRSRNGPSTRVLRVMLNTSFGKPCFACVRVVCCSGDCAQGLLLGCAVIFFL